MSRFKLYWPEDVSDTVDEPAILSFINYYAPQTLRMDAAVGINGRTVSRDDVLTRTRAIHHNQCCPICDRAKVEPLVANDAWVGRNNLPIPGTATLEGFRCVHCEHRWSA
jgi:hypothetical protein